MDETREELINPQDEKISPDEQIDNQNTEEEIRDKIRAEVIKELEAEADRRVEQAYRTFQRKAEQREAQKLEEERQKALLEAEERSAQLEEKRVELIERETRLDICDLIDAYGLPADFREMIPYKDLVCVQDAVLRYSALKNRVIDLKQEFSKQVKKQVAKEREMFTSGFVRARI